MRCSFSLQMSIKSYIIYMRWQWKQNTKTQENQIQMVYSHSDGGEWNEEFVIALQEHNNK